VAKAKPIYDEDGRVCNKCRKYYVWDEFTRERKGFHGRRGICKWCAAEARAELRKGYKLAGEPEVSPKGVRFTVRCETCSHLAECRQRVRNGFRVMCEAPDEADLIREKYPDRMYWNA